MRTIFFFLFLLIMAAVVVSNLSCAVCKPPRNNREMEQRVRKHDNKPFRASNEYRRTTLLSVTRTMKGYRHTFISDEGDTIVKYLYPRLTKDSCYLLKNI